MMTSYDEYTVTKDQANTEFHWNFSDSSKRSTAWNEFISEFGDKEIYKAKDVVNFIENYS